MLKASTQLKIQAVFAGYTLFFSKGSSEEKIHSVTQQMGLFLLTAGMRSGTRQALWQMGLAMAPHFPDMARGAVTGYRDTLQSRTMASIPFSYSTLPMDLALNSLQHGQSRLNQAYDTIGSEAAFMHARLMAK